MKKYLLISIVALSMSALASSSEMFEVLAGFVPIDDGTYHVVVLDPNSEVGDPPIPKFCGKHWSNGFIQEANKSTAKGGGWLPMPGCWAATGTDPKKDTIYFRYFNLSQGGAREFKINPPQLRLMKMDYAGEKLFSTENRSPR